MLRRLAGAALPALSAQPRKVSDRAWGGREIAPGRARARSVGRDTMLALGRDRGVIWPHVDGQLGRVQPMLVLTRKPNQSIMIGDDVEVSVLSVVGEKVRIGINAPHDIPVFRTEIYVEIQREAGEEDGPSSEAVRAEVDEALGKLGEPPPS